MATCTPDIVSQGSPMPRPRAKASQSRTASRASETSRHAGLSTSEARTVISPRSHSSR